MPYMKFFCDEFTPELMKIAEKELGETEEVRTRSIQVLRNLIEKEPDFYPCTEDIFLLRYLRPKKFNVTKAFEVLKRNYRQKARYSRLITDFLPSELSHTLESGQTTFLKYRDQTGAGVLVFRPGQYDIKHYTTEDLTACLTLMQECVLDIAANQICGYSFVVDFTDLDLEKAMHFFSLTIIYKAVMIFLYAFPCRAKGYHIVNEPFYITPFLKFVKQLVSTKIRKRIYVHGKNLNSLHKHIPEDILPEELGGKQGPIAEITKEFHTRFVQCEDHIKKRNTYGYRGKTLELLKRR